MKTFILSIAFIITISATAQAQPASTKELVQELFTIMHQDSMLIKTMEASSAMMARQMTTSLSTLDSATSRGMKDAVNKSMASSRETIVKLMKEELVDIYAKYFTPDEIRQFIAFYKTAAGQKMISTTPLITKDLMEALSVKYMPGMQQTMRKDMEKVVSEMKSKKPM